MHHALFYAASTLTWNMSPHKIICKRHNSTLFSSNVMYRNFWSHDRHIFTNITVYHSQKTIILDLVEQINLCIGIAGITRMPEQQLNETYKCVESVEALHSDACHDLARLGQRSVAQIHTHLGTQTEETCYQVVGLEDTLKMHLSHNDIVASCKCTYSCNVSDTTMNSHVNDLLIRICYLCHAATAVLDKEIFLLCP